MVSFCSNVCAVAVVLLGSALGAVVHNDGDNMAIVNNDLRVTALSETLVYVQDFAF